MPFGPTRKGQENLWHTFQRAFPPHRIRWQIHKRYFYNNHLPRKKSRQLPSAKKFTTRQKIKKNNFNTHGPSSQAHAHTPSLLAGMFLQFH